jgi:hypothetical protein
VVVITGEAAGSALEGRSVHPGMLSCDGLRACRLDCGLCHDAAVASKRAHVLRRFIGDLERNLRSLLGFDLPGCGTLL